MESFVCRCKQFFELWLPVNEKLASAIHKMRPTDVLCWMRKSFAKSSRCCMSHASNIFTHWNRYSKMWRTERIILCTVEFWNCRTRETTCALERETSLIVSCFSSTVSTGTKRRPTWDRSHVNQFLYICVSSPVKLLQYTGIGIVHGFRSRHAMPFLWYCPLSV